MSYYINCSILYKEGEYQFEEELEEELIDEEAIWDYTQDWFWDLATETLHAYHASPIAVFNEEEITKSFFQQAYNYIFSKKNEWFITLID